MQFKKLELSGFKSFFDKTNFFIEDGLTGIVGPNGCGKSNIVEALRWCMGETSAKSMRGSGMEDVIFSGTSNRPQKNISEVSITIDNSRKEGQGQFIDLEEIQIKRKIERDKGSKYFINGKEVRAKDAQTFFADLSTGAHSPSMISQGKIGMIVTAKPAERKSVLEEAAGISGIHMRRHEAETRLNAAENNLKRADELKRQQEKQLDNLKKQAEDATKYREISEKIKSSEAALYYLKIQNIEKEKSQLKNQSSDINNQINSLKNNIDSANVLFEEENKKLQPLKDKKIENLSKLQKINLEITNLQKDEERIKDLNKKIQNNLKTIDSDLEREKSISLDASLNEKRMLEEKNELLKTEKELFDIEDKSKLDLEISSRKLKELQIKLDNLISEIETYIDTDRKLSKETFGELKQLINKITSSQEEYGIYFGKNETIKSDSIKRKERINNIDQELENWKDLKLNSEKMILELTGRRKKLSIELEENQKNPEKIAINKGQNLQNLENTKKQIEELEIEIEGAEKKYNLISEELKSLQENFTVLRENKARFEATVEGIDQRKMDLIYIVKKELKIDNINNLFPITGFTDPDKLPSIDEQENSLTELKKNRESLGSVNLRAD